MKNWTFIEGLQFEDNNYGSGYPAGMFTVKNNEKKEIK